MKSFYLATVTVAALLATPALAQDRAGSVGVNFSNANLAIEDSDTDADIWTVDGTVALPVADWTVILDGVVDKADSDAGDTTFGGGAVHLTRTFGSDIRFGGFLGADGLGDGDQSWLGGLEAQKYLSKATLTAQTAYTSIDDLDMDVWTLGGEAAFYPMARLRLHIDAAYNGVQMADEDVDAWSYGAGAEYWLPNTAFTVVGDFNRLEWEAVEIDTWTFGLRFNFGGDLQERDRRGGALRFNPMMRTLNAFGSSGGDNDTEVPEGPGGPV